MRIRVKMRKQDKQPIIPVLIATFVFGSIGVACIFRIISYFKDFNLEYFLNNIELSFFIILSLGALGLYFIFLFFKPSKNFLGELIKKETLVYEGKNICNMHFKLKGRKSHLNMCCYTEEENELTVGNEYVLKIKEFNWQIKNISNRYETEKLSVVKEPTLRPVFYLFFFFLGAGIAILVFKICYDLVHKNNILLDVIPLIIVITMMYYVLKMYRSFYDDNEIEHDKDLKLQEQKMDNVLLNNKVLKRSNKKVPSMYLRIARKTFLTCLIAFLIIFLILNLNLLIINKSITKVVSLSKGSLVFYLGFITFLFILGCIRMLFMLKYKNYDEKLIKDNMLNVSGEPINLKEILLYRIFRPTYSSVIEKYYIIDDKNNLLFRIDNDEIFSNKYVIIDNSNNKVGEICRKTFTGEYCYVIKLVDEAPFSIRRKLTINHDYEIIGRDYIIKGDAVGITNMVEDKSGNRIGSIKANQTKSEKFIIGDTIVKIEKPFENNKEIMLLAFSITVTNFHK